MKARFIRLVLAWVVAVSAMAILGVSRGAPEDPKPEAAKPPAAKPATLPFVIYCEKGSPTNHYAPSGWMGNAAAIKMDEGCRTRPHSGATCLRFEYQDEGGWGGVVWQDPLNDWGTAPGGWNLSGAKKLTVWARGEKGGEGIAFRFGLLGPDKTYPDSATGALNDVKLTSDWKQYTIDLSGKDLSTIKTGFAWTLAGQGAPVVFYLDDIRFE